MEQETSSKMNDEGSSARGGVILVMMTTLCGCGW